MDNKLGRLKLERFRWTKIITSGVSHDSKILKAISRMDSLEISVDSGIS